MLFNHLNKRITEKTVNYDNNPYLKSKLLKSKRKAQSALEYMMTYGWAILIIVIVAVVLYSLGIFNPSSSITATVTGFAGLGTPSAICYSNGVLNITMGDSVGYPIYLDSITFTNSSNGVVVETPDLLIKPGSTNLFSIPNICPAAGRYVINAKIEYTEPTQSLQGPYFSTGTVTGTVVKYLKVVKQTVFIEYNLPANTQWNATYDSILEKSTTNQITFPITSGTYSYTVHFVNTSKSQGCAYTPTSDSRYLSGTLNAGSTLDINFFRVGCTPLFTLYKKTSTSSSNSLKFTVPADYSSSNLVILEGYSGDLAGLTINSVPSSCTVLNESLGIGGYAGVYTAACIESPGTYYFNISNSSSSPYVLSLSSAAYVFNGTHYSLESNMSTSTSYNSYTLNATLKQEYPLVLCGGSSGFNDIKPNTTYTQVFGGSTAIWDYGVSNYCAASVNYPSGVTSVGLTNSTLKEYNLTFKEEGLAAGSKWTVNFNGTNYTSTNKDQSIILNAYSAQYFDYNFYNVTTTFDGCSEVFQPIVSSGAYNPYKNENETVIERYKFISSSCTPFTLYKKTSTSSSNSLKFTVPADYSSSNLVILEGYSGDLAGLTINSVPSSCTVLNESLGIGGYAGVYTAACIESPGTYYFNISNSSSSPYVLSLSSAAYVFNGTHYSLESNMSTSTSYNSYTLNATLKQEYPLVLCGGSSGFNDIKPNTTYTQVFGGSTAIWDYGVSNYCAASVNYPSGVTSVGLTNSTSSYSLP